MKDRLIYMIRNHIHGIISGKFRAPLGSQAKHLNYDRNKLKIYDPQILGQRAQAFNEVLVFLKKYSAEDPAYTALEKYVTLDPVKLKKGTVKIPKFRPTKDECEAFMGSLSMQPKLFKFVYFNQKSGAVGIFVVGEGGVRIDSSFKIDINSGNINIHII